MPSQQASQVLGPRRPRGAARPLVRTDVQDGSSRVWIEGAFDALTAEEVLRSLEPLMAGRPRRVTVHLDGVPLMDSCGVSALLSLSRRIEAHGGSVVIVGARDQPLAVLQLLKLEALLGML